MTRRQGHDLVRARQVAAERARQRRLEQEQVAAQVRQNRWTQQRALEASCRVGDCSAGWAGIRALGFERLARCEEVSTSSFPVCALHLRMPLDQLIREGLPGGSFSEGLGS